MNTILLCLFYFTIGCNSQTQEKVTINAEVKTVHQETISRVNYSTAESLNETEIIVEGNAAIKNSEKDLSIPVIPLIEDNSTEQRSNTNLKTSTSLTEKAEEMSKDKKNEDVNVNTSFPELEAIENQTELIVHEVEESPIQNFDHSAFDVICKKYISSAGAVDYAGINSNSSQLDDYLNQLRANVPSDDWSKDAQLAYWINAYNAFTIKLIIDNYPLESIMDLHNGQPWKEEWITLGSKTYSLDNIEHDIIRPTFQDARIHFAVNCAAKSCPPINNKAWTEANLQKELERVTTVFINNKAYNTITNGNLALSSIFKWYSEDFGDLVSYINEYSNTKIKSGSIITFRDYNWELNMK